MFSGQKAVAQQGHVSTVLGHLRRGRFQFSHPLLFFEPSEVKFQSRSDRVAVKYDVIRWTPARVMQKSDNHSMWQFVRYAHRMTSHHQSGIKKNPLVYLSII